MGTVSAAAVVTLDPADARDLWLDTARWATFVDGFSHVERVQRDWPAEGGVLTWMSTPHGRGHVREAVTTYRVQEVVADIADSQLTGTQRATFVLTPDGTQVEVSLTYRLTKGNPIVDLLFVRRALRDSLRRTVLRYAREAFAEAELAAADRG